MGDSHLWTSSTGYTVNNPAAWGPPIPPTSVVPPPRFVDISHTRGVKRPMSESDDCDDVFSEESSKDRCSSPNDDCQMGFSRKKRRGIIEKRRRDRINSSLLELRRLVPSAFEKQGSAKLEKAEILQMTVDHLKTLHSKGVDALSYDPHKFAMDYHNIGFRECAAEVARYLVTVEGMDIQDPLRLRLMSHLQCFATQRELASKQPNTPWNYNTYSTIHEPYPPPSNYEMPSVSQHQPSHLQPTITPQTSAGSRNTPTTDHHLSPNRHLESPRGNSSQPTGYPPHHQYQFPQQGYNPSGQVKPYRPWGAEVAY